MKNITTQEVRSNVTPSFLPTVLLPHLFWKGMFRQPSESDLPHSHHTVVHGPIYEFESLYDLCFSGAWNQWTSRSRMHVKMVHLGRIKQEFEENSIKADNFNYLPSTSNMISLRHTSEVLKWSTILVKCWLYTREMFSRQVSFLIYLRPKYS